jgi:hypothetical protein
MNEELDETVNPQVLAKHLEEKRRIFEVITSSHGSARRGGLLSIQSQKKQALSRSIHAFTREGKE